MGPRLQVEVTTVRVVDLLPALELRHFRVEDEPVEIEDEEGGVHTR